MNSGRMGRAEIGVYGGLRVVDLPAGVTLSEIVGWVKTGLNLDYVQVRRGGKLRLQDCRSSTPAWFLSC